ncbi:hypothetical protein B0H14DRAFT_2599045 [Mycena olivaceomarginata]|nr:hypothetical protein B0H14DRAFT_2599045 [Mycena olivaceomarginata]
MSEGVPVQEYVNYGSNGGLGGRGGVRREDDKQVAGAGSRKHGKIIAGSGRLQEQTEGGQRSWTVSPPSIEQRQNVLRIGSHGRPALASCDVQPVEDGDTQVLAPQSRSQPTSKLIAWVVQWYDWIARWGSARLPSHPPPARKFPLHGDWAVVVHEPAGTTPRGSSPCCSG